MFTEKWKLLDALKAQVPNLNISESTEYAVEHGGKYPTCAVDFGIWQAQGTSEDGSVYDVIPQYMITIFLKPTPGNQRAQETEAQTFHDAVWDAVIGAFPGIQFTMYGQPAGTVPFGSASAFAISYQLDLGAQAGNS